MNTQANQFYKEPWFGIVLTIIFFPAGIYVMFKFGPWHKRTKTILAIVLSLICIVVWTVAGLAPASSNPGVGETWLSTKKANQNVKVTTKLNFTVDAAGRVRLHGSTNLPDQTKIHVTVTHGSTVVGDDLTVNKHAWTSAALTHNGQPLTPATYDIHVTTVNWSKQPQKVTNKLGTDGQHLRGADTVKTKDGRTLNVRQAVTYKP